MLPLQYNASRSGYGAFFLILLPRFLLFVLQQGAWHSTVMLSCAQGLRRKFQNTVTFFLSVTFILCASLSWHFSLVRTRRVYSLCIFLFTFYYCYKNMMSKCTRALTFQELVLGKYATGLSTKGGFLNFDDKVKSLGTSQIPDYPKLH